MLVLHLFALYIFFFCLPATPLFFFFFFNDTATTEIYTLSLHDALPISSMTRPSSCSMASFSVEAISAEASVNPRWRSEEHTSESSHLVISYAVFCLKKKKKKK